MSIDQAFVYTFTNAPNSLSNLASYLYQVNYAFAARMSISYGYLWKSQYELAIDYILLDSINDALLNSGIGYILRFGLTPTQIAETYHFCFGGHNHASSSSSASKLINEEAAQLSMPIPQIPTQDSLHSIATDILGLTPSQSYDSSSSAATIVPDIRSSRRTSHTHRLSKKTKHTASKACCSIDHSVAKKFLSLYCSSQDDDQISAEIDDLDSFSLASLSSTTIKHESFLSIENSAPVGPLSTIIAGTSDDKSLLKQSSPVLIPEKTPVDEQPIDDSAILSIFHCFVSGVHAFAVDFIFHLVIKSVFVLAFPLIHEAYHQIQNCYSWFTQDAGDKNAPSILGSWIQYLVVRPLEFVIKYTGINPFEGIFMLNNGFAYMGDVLSKYSAIQFNNHFSSMGEKVINYSPMQQEAYLNSRAEDPGYEQFMKELYLGLEALDGAMHSRNNLMNLWQNRNAPYVVPKAALLFSINLALKLNTDSEEAKIDSEISNRRAELAAKSKLFEEKIVSEASNQEDELSAQSAPPLIEALVFSGAIHHEHAQDLKAAWLTVLDSYAISLE